MTLCGEMLAHLGRGHRIAALSRACAARSTLVRRLAAASKDQDRFAILIDGDNVPPRLAGPILDEVSEHVHGIAVDRRVYGDFSLARLDAWKVEALTHGLELKMQASPSKTKNSTDIALCIDAMDILHTSKPPIDTFVIVTNDGDFAPLAQRLRRSGVSVVAVGTGSTLIASSDSHVVIDWARTPSTNHHAEADVALLADVMYDLATSVETARGANRARAQTTGDSAPRPVSINALANAVDRKHPSWRRQRMADFINFRHMLESAPYRHIVELDVVRTARGHVAQHVRLRAHRFETISTARAAAAAEVLDSPDGVDDTERDMQVAASDARPTWVTRICGWFGWSAASRAGAAPGGSAGQELDVAPGMGGTVAARDTLDGVPLGFDISTDADAAIVARAVARLADTSSASERASDKWMPPGSGWVHFDPLAKEMDDVAESTGRGRGWRKEGNVRMSTFLQRGALKAYIEVSSVRVGPSTVHWWARLKR